MSGKVRGASLVASSNNQPCSSATLAMTTKRKDGRRKAADGMLGSVRMDTATTFPSLWTVRRSQGSSKVRSDLKTAQAVIGGCFR